MAKKEWKTALIVLVSVTAGFLLAGSGILSRVHGQSEGRTAGVICVVGQAVSQYAPIVLIDVPDQTILVYEYGYQNDTIELTAARTFRWDKLLTDFQTDGVTVEEVRREVTRRQR